MKKLWLTYCWKDNEAEQVDYVVQELRAGGLDVRFDRAQIIPGQRLWQQIDAAISDDAQCDAWAIYATRASLSSEACLEELAIALDRALRTRGQAFPIIGIFPDPLDRSLIPGAIATRLYVDLRDPQWAAKVLAGVSLVPPSTTTKGIAPFVVHTHHQGDKVVIEIRPRAGRWYPFLAVVPIGEQDLLTSVLYGPAGRPPGGCMVSTGEVVMNQGGVPTHKGMQISHAIDPLNSAYVYLKAIPSQMIFGPTDGEKYRFDRTN